MLRHRPSLISGRGLMPESMPSLTRLVMMVSGSWWGKCSNGKEAALHLLFYQSFSLVGIDFFCFVGKEGRPMLGLNLLDIFRA